MTAVRILNSNGVAVSGVTDIGGTNGIAIIDSTNINVRAAVCAESDQDGVLVDGSAGCDIQAVVRNADRHGFHVTDSERNRISGVVQNAGQETNDTYDAVILDGDSDFNRIAVTVVDDAGGGNRMRYGVNISASTCNTNVEASLLIGAGATGPYNDAGTDTRTTDDHIVS